MATTAHSVQQRSVEWFDQENWTVFEFQRQAWQAWHHGESGLIHHWQPGWAHYKQRARMTVTQMS